MMRSSHAIGSIVALAGVALLCACTPYRFGTQSLYAPDITTVYVPVFSSNSFRPDLGERLTEEVIHEIHKRTPYKVVNNPNADSVLSGQLVRDVKRITIESATDEAREYEIDFVVRVSWVDRNNAVLQQGNVPIPSASVQLLQSVPVRPEIGQATVVGQQQAIQGLAQQIVSMMEQPW